MTQSEHSGHQRPARSTSEVAEHASPQPDPVIVDAVENVSNRFGAQGLCDLIALAHEELAKAEEALRGLSARDR